MAHIQNQSLTHLSTLIPRIGRKIAATWGTEECRAYMVTLLTDTRNGTRAGFDPMVAKIIYQLLADHDAAFPQLDTSGVLEAEFSGSRTINRNMECRGHDIVKNRLPVLLEWAVYGIILFLLIGFIKFAVEHNVVSTISSMM